MGQQSTSYQRCNKKKFTQEEYVNKICISFVTLCVNTSTQIKQGLLLKKHQLQIKNAIVDWVYQLQKFLKHVAGESPRRKHTTSRTRRKFEINNISPLSGGNCKTHSTIRRTPHQENQMPHLPYLPPSLQRSQHHNLTSYRSITRSTPQLPIESINAPVLPYSRKGYITTDENLITHLENCRKYTYV
jgi:hypothetical protein